MIVMEQIAETRTEAPLKKRNWTHDLRSRMGVLGELFGFLWKVKLWWLIPMLIVLLVFVVVFVFAPSTPIGPLIYPLR